MKKKKKTTTTKTKNSAKGLISNSSLMNTESYEMRKIIKNCTKFYFVAISRKRRERQRQMYAILMQFLVMNQKCGFAYDIKMAASSICMHLTAVCLEKCSMFSITTRKEKFYSCKEIDHPTLLECSTGDTACRFKQPQETAFLLFW